MRLVPHEIPFFQDETNFDFAKWQTLLEVEVPSGGEVRVRLP